MFHVFLGWHLIISVIVAAFLFIAVVPFEDDYNFIIKGYIIFQILLAIGEFGVYLII